MLVFGSGGSFHPAVSLSTVSLLILFVLAMSEGLLESQHAGDDAKKRETPTRNKASHVASQTAANETIATQTVYHYTDAQGIKGIVDSGKILASGSSDAKFGPGVYGTGKGPGSATKKQIIRNNYGGAFREFGEGKAEHVIELKVPKHGKGRPEKIKVKNEPRRDIKVVSEKDYKLNGSERSESFESFKRNAGKYAAEDAVVEIGSAAVVGAAVGGAVAALHAGARWAMSEIDGEEALKETFQGASVGVATGAVAKVADLGCQCAARKLAAKGLARCSAAAGNTVPVLGAVVSLGCAGHEIYQACDSSATDEQMKSAFASAFEAGCSTVATIVIFACEASGPIGWGIIAVGLLGGWAIRTFC